MPTMTVRTPKEEREHVLMLHHYSETNARRVARRIVSHTRMLEAIHGVQFAKDFVCEDAMLRVLCKRFLVSEDHYELVAKLVRAQMGVV